MDRTVNGRETQVVQAVDQVQSIPCAPHIKRRGHQASFSQPGKNRVQRLNLAGATDRPDPHLIFCEVKFSDQRPGEPIDEIARAGHGNALASQIFRPFNIFAGEQDPGKTDERRADQLGVAACGQAGYGRVGGAIEKLDFVRKPAPPAKQRCRESRQTQP